MKKTVKIIFLVLIIIVLLAVLLLNYSKSKELAIANQVADATAIHDCNYSVMGESYTDKIYGKYDCVTFGKQKQNYFELLKKPIEWIVLEKNERSALLLSKYIIDCKAFDYVNIETIDNLSDDKKENIKNVNWSTSSLRKWLNNDFLNSSFDISEKEKILQTHLQDVNTDDKIFCLSEEEYKKYFDNGQYYEGDRELGNHHIYYNGATARNKKAQSYDKYNLFEPDETYDYWLRDKSINMYEQGIEFGTTKTIGLYGGIDFSINTDLYCGVRPAMWVSLE